MRQQFFFICRLIFFILLTAGQSPAWAAETQSTQMSAVVAEIGRIGKAARGTVGAAAVHLETGSRIAINATEFFPMASTVKVAVAAKILDLVDKGNQRLTDFGNHERLRAALFGTLKQLDEARRGTERTTSKRWIG